MIGVCLFSQLNPKPLGECLAHSRCSINGHGTNEKLEPRRLNRKILQVSGIRSSSLTERKHFKIQNLLTRYQAWNEVSTVHMHVYCICIYTHLHNFICIYTICVCSILYCKCSYIICTIYNSICKPLRSINRDMVPIFSPQIREHCVTVILIIKSLCAFQLLMHYL